MKAFHRLVRCFIDLNLYSAADETLKMFKETFPSQASSSSVRAMEQEIEKKLVAHQLLQQQRAANKTKAEAAAEPEQEGEDDEMDAHPMRSGLLAECSAQENHWRAKYWDYTARFAGHCNTTTDIKEANFFGE